MDPLITVLLPTRKRVQKLRRAIASLLACSKDLLIAVYVHEDDEETKSLYHLFSGYPILWAYGPKRDIAESGKMLTTLADTKTPWVWFFNDDVVVMTKLDTSKLTEKAIYQPEVHRLGFSRYVKDESCPFFIIPNGCWRDCGQPEILHPTDLTTLRLLREHNYPTRFIPGLEVWHDREEKDCKRINA